MGAGLENGGRVNFGLAWLLLCVTFVLHCWDEIAHGFLIYFNATALTLYSHFWWFPRLDMDFQTMLFIAGGLSLVLFAFTPFAYRNARWFRPLAYLAAAILFLDGCGHIALTIRGKAMPSVVFDGPAPGFYTSPLLLIFSAYLWWRLRTTKLPAKA